MECHRLPSDCSIVLASFRRKVSILPLLLFPWLPALGMGQDVEVKSESPISLRLQKFDLLNGLKAFVVQQTGVPTVAVALAVKAGSTADPPSKGGLANLVAQALFSANKKKTSEQWRDEIESLGVEFSMRVEQEATLFQASVPIRRLPDFLILLHTMVVRPLLEPERVEKVKQSLVQASLENQGDLQLADRIFRGLIFANHPYGKPPQGESSSLKAIQPGDVDSFYQSFYVPNNSTLIIAGDVAANEIMSIVREKWGGWTKGTRLDPLLPRIRVRDNSSIQVIQKRNSPHSAVVYGHVGPPRVTSDYFSLRVLNAALGEGGSASLLSRYFEIRKLRPELLMSQLYFYEVGGEFEVRATVPNESVAQTIQTISETIEGLKQNRLTETELEAAQAALIKDFSEGLKFPLQVASLVATMELYDLASDFLVTFPRRIEQVTVERVQEAAKTYLDTSRALVVVVGDSDKFSAELNRLGSVEILPSSPPTGHD